MVRIYASKVYPIANSLAVQISAARLLVMVRNRIFVCILRPSLISEGMMRATAAVGTDSPWWRRRGFERIPQVIQGSILQNTVVVTTTRNDSGTGFQWIMSQHVPQS